METTKEENRFIYNLPHAEYSSLCRILDQNNAWKELGGTHMKYDRNTIRELDSLRFVEKSPSDGLLTKWGQYNHTVEELFILLHRMKHYQAMMVIKSFVDRRFHKLMKVPENVTSMLANINLSSETHGTINMNLDHTQDKILNVKVMPHVTTRMSQPGPSYIPGSSPNSPRPPITFLPHQRMGTPLNVQTPVAFTGGSAAFKMRVISTPPRSPGPLEDMLGRVSTGEAGMSCVIQTAGPIPHIPYEELQLATNNWDPRNTLGRGGFGTVYKGKWKHTDVAIKRIELKEDTPAAHKEQINQSIRELHCLNAYRHDNILPIYGYSTGGPQPCLIYRYMSGGSLFNRLRVKDVNLVLNYFTRLNIAIGTARGLHYLHTTGQVPLVHGDIKSANILLDKNNIPHLGDFGLAKEGPNEGLTHLTVQRVHGTRPYLPDEFMRSHKFSIKVDTYSYGVVLFELATSEVAFDKHRHKQYLKDLVTEHEGDILNLMDKRAGDHNGIFEEFVRIGTMCVAKLPKNRPMMENILTDLEVILPE